jgi:outer membrane biosynthesis protein TonB
VIQKDGTVADPHIEICYPKGYFEKVSLDAIKHWTFKPVQGPNGPEESAAFYRFNYRLTGVPASAGHYLKPHQWIRLKYTLTTTGTTKDVQVIATSEPDLPTSEAIDQLKVTQFTTTTKDGQPIEVPDRIIRIVGQE